MSVKDILEGHLKELTDSNEKLFKDRMRICKLCPLYINTTIGPLCNNKLYININDKKTTTKYKTEGYVRGCGCRLNAKTRVLRSKCIINKW